MCRIAIVTPVPTVDGARSGSGGAVVDSSSIPAAMRAESRAIIHELVTLLARGAGITSN
jgi:hypothetical protein